MVYASENVGCNLATLALIIFAFCKAVGEATLVGYMKALPQELIATYGMGTGLSDAIATGVMMMGINFGMTWCYGFAVFGVFLVPGFYLTFLWFEERRLDHVQFRNIFKLDNVDDEDELAKSITSQDLDKAEKEADENKARSFMPDLSIPDTLNTAKDDAMKYVQNLDV